MAKPFFLQARWNMGVALCSLALVAGCGSGNATPGQKDDSSGNEAAVTAAAEPASGTELPTM